MQFQLFVKPLATNVPARSAAGTFSLLQKEQLK